VQSTVIDVMKRIAFEKYWLQPSLHKLLKVSQHKQLPKAMHTSPKPINIILMASNCNCDIVNYRTLE
jgi:hypothetical protein